MLYKIITAYLLPVLIICSCSNVTGEKNNRQEKLLEVPGDETRVKDRQPGEEFSKTIVDRGITFEISATGSGSINSLVIKPSGLETDNRPVEHEILGSVTNAETGDLNNDGFPELVIYITSAGSGSYGTVIAYSVNNGKSFSSVYFPPVTDNPEASKGYMGHDIFSISGQYLVRRFPVYRENDTNANPTGGKREIRYRMIDGEASPIFIIDSVTDIS